MLLLMVFQLVPFGLLVAPFQLDHCAITPMLADSIHSEARILPTAITRGRRMATGANSVASSARKGLLQHTAFFVFPQVIHPMLAAPHAGLADNEAVIGMTVLIGSTAAAEASEFSTAND
jgi:hypothetical protein